MRMKPFQGVTRIKTINQQKLNKMEMFFEQKIVQLSEVKNSFAVVTVLNEQEGKKAYVTYYENGNEITECNEFVNAVFPKIQDVAESMNAVLWSY